MSLKTWLLSLVHDKQKNRPKFSRRQIRTQQTSHRSRLVERFEDRTLLSHTALIPHPVIELAPGDDPEEAIARLHPEHDHHDDDHEDFNLGNRWSSTATDGGGLIQGDPTTLTWGFLNDGTPITGSREGTSNNDLIAFLDNIYGNVTPNTDYTDELWFTPFQSYLERWGEVSGLSYQYEPNDSGDPLDNTSSPRGSLGTVADLRIGGHFIDGQTGSNTLAYNYFPIHGDMVIDTGNTTFYGNTSGNSIRLRNVLAHEHGHGIGIFHVCPVLGGVNGRLMEPFINTSFDGPQFDDILAAQRSYGDALEKAGGNDTSGTAHDLGTLTDSTTLAIGTQANDTFIAPTDTDLVSIDDNSDTDFYSFTTGSSLLVDLLLTPQGPTYLSGVQNGDGSCSAGTNFNSASQSDLTLTLYDTNGSTILTTANATGTGSAESITDFPLTAGTYFVRVTGSADAIQMYELGLSATLPPSDFGDAPSAAQSGFAASYPVTLAENGARHEAKGPQLGANRDTETDGTHSAAANADDTTDTPDDEDGVTFNVSTLVASATTTTTAGLSINLQNPDGSANRLDAWIDFNLDGDWDDAGEKIFNNVNLGTTAGVQTLSFTIPQDTGANVRSGDTYARFRLSTAGTANPTGAALDGEVEDYQVSLADASAAASTTVTIPNGSTVFDLTAASGSTVVTNGSVTLLSVPTVNLDALTIIGTAGNDTLTVDFSGGNPIPTGGASFDGAAESGGLGDAIFTLGGSFTTTTYRFINDNDGSIQFDGSLLTYTDLEPIADNNASVNRVFQFTGGAETVTLSDDSTANNDVSFIDSTLGESVAFANPTGSLTIDTTTGTGADTVNVEGVDSQFNADLTVTGDADDTTQFRAAPTNIGSGSLSVTTRDIIVAETVSVTGNGAIDLNSSRRISSTSGLSPAISAVDGDVVLTADSFLLQSDVSGNGHLTIRPKTTSLAVSIGGGTAGLAIDDAELGFLVDGFQSITIGDVNNGTGAVDIDTALFRDSVVIAGGIISDDAGTDVDAGGNDVTLIGNVSPGQSPGILNVIGDFTFANDDTYTVEIGGITAGDTATSHDQINVTGTVAIGSNVALSLEAFNGFVPAIGESFVIVNNDGTDAVTGTFAGLPDDAVISNFLGTSLSAVISYDGADGNGNDVVLTAQLATTGSLIGIDLGGGTTPSNWTAHSGTSDVTLNNLTDESGATTVVDVSLNFDGSPGSYGVFTANASQLPNHTQSLAGIDRAYQDTGNIELTFSDLTIGQEYEIYVFGGDTLNGGQTVTITGDTALPGFNQNAVANTLYVNDEVGDSGRDLDSFATDHVVKPDASGEILIRVAAAPPGTSLAAVAIREKGTPIPDVLIGDVTVNEGDGTATFDVTLTTVAVDDVTLTLATANATATAGSDYTGKTAQVVIPRGTTAGTFVVDITQDVVDEPTETFTVAVQSVDAGTVGDTSDEGIGTITDDDTSAVTVDDVAVTEGGDLVFTVTLDVAVQGGTDVIVSFADVTATGGAAPLVAPEDFANDSVVLNFTGTAGEAHQVTVATLDDVFLEAAETLTVSLASSNTLVVDTDTGTGTINDNDTARVTVEDITVTEGGDLVFVVTLNNAVQGAFDVDVSFANVTATGGAAPLVYPEDFANDVITLNFSGTAGEAHSATVASLDDAVAEGTETFTVNLDASNALVTDNDTATGTLNDNDTASLTLSIDAASVSEGAGADATTATVTRNTDPGTELIVVLASDDLSEATVPPTVTIPVGQFSAVFDIDAVDDSVLDGVQTVTLSATAPGHSMATDSIDVTDDDSAGMTIVESGGQTTVSENFTTDTFTVELTAEPVSDVVILLSSADTDEVTVSPSTLTFTNLDWDSPRTVTVTGVRDSIVDGDQITAVVLSVDDANSDDDFDNVADQTVLVTTTDVDFARLSVRSPQVTILESDGTDAIRTIVSHNLDPSGSPTVVVTLTTADTDEIGIPAQVTIPAGQSFVEFSIDAVDDLLADGTQIASIGAAATGLSSGLGRVYVEDNEEPGFSLTISPNPVSETDGAAAATATLSRNTEILDPLTVDLFSSDLTEITLPATVSFADGESTVTFPLNAVDDAIADGIQNVLITVSEQSAAAAPARRDIMFGDSGRIQVELVAGGWPRRPDVIAVQPDGRILVAGVPPTDDSLRLMRFHSDGSPDTTFGVNGVADIAFSMDNFLWVRAMDIHSDGRIVVTGSGSLPANQYLIARFNADGTPDNSFGTTGVVSTVPQNVGTFPQALGVVANDDGSVVVAASGVVSTVSVVKHRPDGSVERQGSLSVGAGNNYSIQALTKLPGGDVLVTGKVRIASDWHFFAARFQPDLTPNAGFGAGGLQIVSSIESSSVDAVPTVAYPDGRILISGTTASTDGDFLFVRLNPDGSPDTTFGTGGNVVIDSPAGADDQVGDIVLRPDGKVVAVGSSFENGVGTHRTIVQLNSDGTPDTGFATNGYQQLDALPAIADQSFSAALQTDGGLILYSGGGNFGVSNRIERFDMDPAPVSVSATIDVTDDEVPELTLVIAADIIDEADGAAATTATVSRNTEPIGDLTITLSSSNPGLVSTVGMITIPDGQMTSAPFNLDAIDNVFANAAGFEVVTIAASATAHADGADTVDVTDNDVPELTLTIDAAEIGEGDGPAATTATVTRNFDMTEDLVVSLLSDDTSEATVPPTVTIPAGDTTLQFDIDAVDDLIVDGNRTVVVTATNFVAATTATVDTSFGSNGLYVTDLWHNISPLRYDMARQPDGRILAIGKDETDDQIWRVLRLNADGTPDGSFGTGGAVETRFTSETNVRPFAIEVLNDGRIVVLGRGGTDTIVTRFMPDGTADLSFDSDGIAVYPDSVQGLVLDIAVNLDGSMWIAGSTVGDSSLGFPLTKINIDGSTGSTVRTNVGSSDTSQEEATQILVQPDGRIVVSGIVVPDGTSDVDAFVARFNSDGSPDTSFDVDGVAPVLGVGIADRMYVTDIELDAGNRILISGGPRVAAAGTPIGAGFIARVNADGTTDTSFSGDGIAQVGFDTREVLNAVEVLPDGKILGLGAASVPGLGNERMIVRFNSDGSLDSTFDGDGVQLLPSLPSVFEEIASGLVLPDGRLITFSERFGDYRIERFQLFSGSGVAASDTVIVTDDDVATLFVDIAADSIRESDGAAATTATITRNTVPTGDLLVTLMSDDTSEATVIGMVTIPDGDVSVTVDIDAVADNLVDVTQTATITAMAAGYVDGVDTVDVLNDDFATLSIANVAMDEGNSASQQFVFTVMLDVAVETAFTVDFQTRDGVATVADGDYDATSGTLMFRGDAGETETLSVTVNGDLKLESDETFFTDLFNVQARGRDVRVGPPTITELDTLFFAATDFIGQIQVEGSVAYVANSRLLQIVDVSDPANLTVIHSIPVPSAILDMRVVGNIAYLASGSAGLRVLDISNPANPVELSLFDTPGNAIRLDVVGTTVFIGDRAGGVRILDASDPQAIVEFSSFSLADATEVQAVGNRLYVHYSSGIVILDITDPANPAQIGLYPDIGVTAFHVVGNLAYVDDSLFRVLDVSDPGNIVELGTGPSVANVREIQVVGTTAFTVADEVSLRKLDVSDVSNITLAEEFLPGTSAFQLDVSSGVAFISHDNRHLRALNVGRTSATGTIINDDSAALTIDSVSQVEGTGGTTTDFIFTVTLDNDVQDGFVVDFTTNDDTATVADSDYVDNDASLTFAGIAGETQAITVAVNHDAKVELDEIFTVALGAVSGADPVVTGAVSVPANAAQGSVINDDAAEFSINSVAITERDSGSRNLTFTVTLDVDVDTALSVDFATVDGTATVANGDYTTTGGTLNFLGTAGETRRLNVPIIGDLVVELDETFDVLLSGVVAAGRVVTVDNTGGTGTILNDDQAVLAIDNVTTAEGDTATTTFVFTVTADSAVDTAYTVNFSTADFTATTADSDYQSASGTLNFSGTFGETQTLEVQVVGDERVELDEAFLVALSNISAVGRNVVASAAPGSGNITNDDSASVIIDDVIITETDSGSTSAVFTVTLDSTVDAGVTVSYNTSDNTALISDTDYTRVSAGTVSFSAGSVPGATRTLSVQVTGDTKVELDEAFHVNLSGVAAAGRNVSVTDNLGVGTILNDDSATLSIDNVALTEGDSGSRFFTFTVMLDAAVDTSLTTNFATADDTATTADADYATATGTLSFVGTAGETQTLQVEVNGDQIVEADETFLVDLSGLSAGGRSVTIAASTGTGTILNDDGANLSIADVSITEGDSGSQNLVFTITLDSDVDVPVAVDFATSDGTAMAADNDYASTASTVSFSGTAGETQSVAVPITGDLKVEADETFLADLSNITAAGRSVGFSDSQARGTILNDDTASITISDVTVQEGNSGTTTFDFIATLDGEVTSPVLVDYSIAASTASAADGDYIDLPGTIVFAANAGSGNQTVQISVDVVGDAKVELDETFFVDLSNAVSGGLAVSIADAQGIGTILNDDTATVAINDVGLVEGDSGSQLLTFTITLDGEVDASVGLTYSTGNDTASIADNDFSFTSGSLNFAANNGPGLQTMTVAVPVNGDVKVEGTETFTLNLQALQPAGRSVQFGDATGVGTITDNDTATISIADVSLAEGDADLTEFSFEVVLNGVVDRAVDIDYATADGTATTADSDYTARTGTLNFRANSTGSQTLTVVVQVRGDEKVELDEDFTLNLVNLVSNGRNVAVTDDSAIGQITNDDSALLSIRNGSAPEGDQVGNKISLTVVLDHTVDADVVVEFATADGTAFGGGIDFVSNSGMATIAAGQSSTTIDIQLVGDRRIELNERFFVGLSNLMSGGRNVLLSSTPATATILNDDTGVLDIDDNQTADAATDGILALRYLFGFRGTALTNGAIGAGAGNSTSAGVEAILNDSQAMLDVDGNGTADAATDGILILRYLFGFRGDVLVNGAVGAGATRTTGAQVAAFLDDFAPITLPPAPAPPEPAVASAQTGGSEQSKAGVTVAVNDQSTTFAWSPVGKINRYRLTLQQEDSGRTVVQTIMQDKTSAKSAPLTGGTYRVWVEAIRADGSADPAATQSAVFSVASTANTEVSETGLQLMPALLRRGSDNPVSIAQPQTAGTVEQPNDAAVTELPVTAESFRRPAAAGSLPSERPIAASEGPSVATLLSEQVGDQLMEHWLQTGDWLE